MIIARSCFAIFMVAYIFLFSFTENHFKEAKLRFSAPLPAPVLEGSLGFLKHLAAEVLFVKAAVFLGAPHALLPEEEEYAENMSRNFEVVSDLYPEFKDAYYLAQSSIAHVSPEYSGRVISILEKGIKAYPDELLLPFLKGFNHYYYRDEWAHAAEIFADLATWPEAPTWLGHLASVLSARGGDLRASLLTLEVVYATEQDEYNKERYAKDIERFKKAIAVEDAIKLYRAKYNEYPLKLEQLVPDFIERIPEIGGDFELVWIPPRLRLTRPLKPSSVESSNGGGK